MLLVPALCIVSWCTCKFFFARTFVKYQTFLRPCLGVHWCSEMHSFLIAEKCFMLFSCVTWVYAILRFKFDGVWVMVGRGERDRYNVAMLRAVLFEFCRPTRDITCISSAFLLIGNAVYRPTVVCLWLEIIKHLKNQLCTISNAWVVSLRSLKWNSVKTKQSFSIDYLHRVESSLSEKFRTFFGTGKFIAVITRNRHWTPSWGRRSCHQPPDTKYVNVINKCIWIASNICIFLAASIKRILYILLKFLLVWFICHVYVSLPMYD